MGILGSLAVIIDFALGLYVWLILIRVLLSWVNPDPYNPIVQFLVQATDPVLVPLRRLIPPVAGLDLSPIAALLGISVLQRLLVGLFRGGMGGGAMSSLLAELLGVAHLLLTFYLLLLLIRGGFHLHAWFTFRQGRPFRINLNQPATRFIFQATEPAVRPLRSLVPNVSGLDITPLAAALALYVALSLIQTLIVRLSMPMASPYGG